MAMSALEYNVGRYDCGGGGGGVCATVAGGG